MRPRFTAGRRRSASDRCGPSAPDLGVGVHRHEAAAELITIADPDQPGIVVRAAMAEG